MALVRRYDVDDDRMMKRATARKGEWDIGIHYQWKIFLREFEVEYFNSILYILYNNTSWQTIPWPHPSTSFLP
jgi:hypothetical protein